MSNVIKHPLEINNMSNSKTKQLYLEETECRHCGAPLNIFYITKDAFSRNTSAVKSISTINVTPEELDSIYGIDDGNVAGVIHTLSTCSSCRQY